MRFAVIMMLLVYVQIGFAGGYNDSLYHPQFKTMQSGADLVKGLEPKHPEIQKMFGRFIDVSALKYTEEPPPNRYTNRKGYNDAAQMLGLRILIDRGDIKAGTLIISDTGHDLSTAGFLMANYSQKFTIQAVFYYPAQLYKAPGNYERITSQAQDWGEDIAYWQEKYAARGRPDIVYLGLEGHRKEFLGIEDGKGKYKYLYEIPRRLLPTKEQWEKIGINKVIFLTEAHPNAKLETIMKKMRRDVKIYIEELNMPTTYLGNDCRREVGCF